VTQSSRQALASLRRSPGFAGLTALTLGVGIGATTAIFSVFDAVLLRPLPYPDSEELVVLRVAMGEREIDNHSEPEFWDLSSGVSALNAVAAYRREELILGTGADPVRVPVVRSTSALLPLLGTPPELGRVFDEDEDVPGSEPVVVLSHGSWTRLFGADRAVIGRSVTLEDRAHTVIGVMPEGFAFPTPDVEAWIPFGLNRAEPWARNNHYLRVVARLADGRDLAAATAELDALGARSTAEFPDFYSNSMTFRAYSLRERTVGDVRPALLLLFGAVAGVLLIASVNAAGLFLARGARRLDEVAVRTALGAGRLRVATQLLAESLFVAGLAGILGVVLARLGVTALVRLAPPGLPRLAEIGVDGRVLGFGLAAALACGLLFGLAPAAQAWRTDVRSLLASGGRGGIGQRRGSRARRTLVVTQLALATTLALGTMLLLRSFAELRNVELGFEPEGVLAVPLAPANGTVAQDAAAVAFYRGLEERVAALPGVSSVGSALRIPLADGHDNFSIKLEGAESVSVGEAPSPGIQWVTPGFFDALGIAVLRGRSFEASDDESGPLVAIVSESLAQDLWPGQEALGQRLRMFVDGQPWMEVVGVVDDIRHLGVHEPVSRMLYIPHAQGYRSAYYSSNRMVVFVRAAEPTDLAAPVRAVVREESPATPVGFVRTMSDVAATGLARERFTLSLLALFAVLALALAAVGVYGVVAQSVATRTREFGLRMAVGAPADRVAMEVVRDGLVLALVGVIAGLMGGVTLSWLVRAALFGVGPLDPWALLGTVPVVVAVALLATLVPARRAARVDPMHALREG